MKKKKIEVTGVGELISENNKQKSRSRDREGKDRYIYWVEREVNDLPPTDLSGERERERGLLRVYRFRDNRWSSLC